jgi:hypothetical protein
MGNVPKTFSEIDRWVEGRIYSWQDVWHTLLISAILFLLGVFLGEYVLNAKVLFPELIPHLLRILGRLRPALRRTFFLERLVDGGFPSDTFDHESFGLRSALVYICSRFVRFGHKQHQQQSCAVFISLLPSICGDDNQMNRRERIIELATEIATMRDKLRAMEVEMDGLIGSEQSTGQATSTAPYQIEKGVSLPKTVTERVVEWLESNKQKSWGVWDIATGIDLPEEKINSLRSTVIRLVDGKRLEKVSPGLYRAKQGE